MADSILILATKAPYGNEEFFAGARLSLAMLASGLISRSTVLMVGDGTLNAVATQKPEAIAMPSNPEAINDLADFEGEVYMVEEDLKARVGDAPVLDGVKKISWERAQELIRDHQLITTF
ncbi:MAG TPA: DsrE family protein [Methanomassiliicoccales archaeon]|nr:DsrE family protein [Methanomassiliicoccales archaeon]